MEKTKKVIERIQKQFGNNIIIDNKALTISGGLGEFDGRVNFDEFVKILDTALYKAKHEGKNRVIIVK